MSTTPSRTSTNNNSSSSPYRVNYSEYVADITGGSPRTARKLPASGIGHHINPLNNPNPSRTNQPTGAMPQYGGGIEKCARCSKSVYLAERKIGASRAFHSSCFSCYKCKRKLDASTLSEHKGEIYCKSCYAKQYGPHGLASGVSMSTEKSGTHESRPTRRSSYGDDLDPTISPYQQMRQRATSSENIFHDEYNSKTNDELSRRYPRYDDTMPRPKSPSNKKDNGLDVIVDTKYQRPTTPTRSDKFIETNSNNNAHRSTYNVEESDPRKYMHEGEKISYGTGTSKIVDIPVVVNPKSQDSVLKRTETPIDPTAGNQRTRSRSRSRSPSIAFNDSYRRQSSRERQNDLTDNYSNLYINTDNSNTRNIRKSSNDNTVDNIIPHNSFATRDYYNTSSYESKYRSSTTNSSGRRSPSPQNNTIKPAPGVNEFVSKTNLTQNTSTSTGNQYSVLGSLITNARPTNNQKDNDDNFDN